MESFNSVMNLNTKAIAFLMQESHLDCILALQNALNRFKGSLPDTDVSMGGSNSSWAIHTVELPRQGSICNDAFEIFNSAFVFLSERGYEGSDTTEGDERIIPAVLLYNLGLCHHRVALREGDSDGLRAASRFYSHALTLLETVAHELTDSEMILLAALANNMAQISSAFFDTKSTRAFQQMLEDILEATDVECLEEEDSDLVFSMNLLMASQLHLHGLAPAA